MDFVQYESDSQYQELIEKIFKSQIEEDPRLEQELGGAGKKKMYEDVRHNAKLLLIALDLGDVKIFENYARWIYQLLCPLMTYCSRERIRDQMTDHYRLLGKHMEKFVDEALHPGLRLAIERAIQVTEEECENSTVSGEIRPKRYEEENKAFMAALMAADTRKAMFLLSEYIKKGIPLTDVYVDIACETMRTVGEMWHQHIITVDQEHYCTSTTQMALSQLYPIIFRQERKKKTMLAACVGSELHEMGARMVADLFEYYGWDSIYLGAAVPPEAVVSALDMYAPKLVALSVTMPEHLIICKDTIDKIREKYPDIPIAVGGKAFDSSNEIWKNWRVDVYTRDARDLAEWAEHTLQ